MKAILWFRNDLRLHDNEALVKAANADEILPLYCIDPRQFAATSFGFSKTGPYRALFLYQTLTDLKKRLQERGADLMVRMGKPEDIIPELYKVHKIDTVITQKEITREETEVEETLNSRIDHSLSFVWGSTLYHINDIPFQKTEIPDVFTSYRKKTEKEGKVRRLLSIPEKLSLIREVDFTPIPKPEDWGANSKTPDSRTAFPFEGGESTALARLKNYIWKKELIKNYKQTRNGLLGADYSSKFSPWLANGSLSPRMIYHEVVKYEEERTKNPSTYWLIFELIWRDYFRFSAWKHGNSLFLASGIQGKKRQWSRNEKDFQQWAEGNTGIPFIDANMRELNETGFMSNRGRQNVASFLSQNLNIDWRMGAEYFESLLLDYDPCSNYGNWAYNATVGHDPRNRYFNIIHQAKKYDPKGRYVRLWIPELEQLSDEYIHEPHKMNSSQGSLFDTYSEIQYPEPMIDLEESYEEIRSRS